MKLLITHLKAPWPKGAKVGDVVELDVLAVPAWAAGKCEPAPDDAEVTDLEAPRFVEPEPVDPLAAQRAEAQAFIDKLRREHESQVAELQGQIQARAVELEAAIAAKTSAEGQVAELQAKLDAASASKKK